MKIKLNETHIAKQPKAKLFRRALEIIKKHDLDNIDPETLDELVAFVCEVFGDSFSVDEVYDHLDADELVPMIIDSLQFVVGQDSDDKKK